MSLGIDPVELQKASEALTTFVNEQSDFFNTPANCKTLQSFLRGEKLTAPSGAVVQGDPIPLSVWASVMIWHAAYSKCKSAGLLETQPPPKTREQLNLEREARDRAEGWRGGVRRAEKTPFEQMKELEERRESVAKHKREQAAAEAQAARAAAAASTDVSMIPTPQQIVDGEALGSDVADPAQLKQNSPFQLKRYMQNTTQAKAIIAQQRLREKARDN